MVVVTQPDIGRLVLSALRSATDVRLAVAYFNPNNEVLDALRDVARLTVIVSEEFTINNPYKLEQLGCDATVRTVPPYCDNGKFHAKTLLVTRPNGGQWALIGSANMMWQGMFSNQEMCVALESDCKSDQPSIEKVAAWFDSLLEDARSPDLQNAKEIYDARSLYRLTKKPEGEDVGAEGVRFWALKTTSGDTGEEHWESFLREGVVAIGWPAINGNPHTMSKAELRDAVADAYGESGRVTPKIRKFISMAIGDVVLICRGYAANSSVPVHIYGFARVTGPFSDQERPNWTWRFKHDAVIQVVDSYLPKDIVAEALGKQALRETIHEINGEAFLNLTKRLGVHLNV